MVTTSTPAQAFSEFQARRTTAPRAQRLRAGRPGNWLTGPSPARYGGSDWGLTIDTAFMLAADGNRPVRLARVTRAIRNHYLDDYASFEGTLSANAIAKSLLAAKVLDQRVRDFGSRNATPAGPEAGGQASGGIRVGTAA
ncbi:MAG: hypothetical protein WKF82_03050 [Nocardioidaceae bacterium]